MANELPCLALLAATPAILRGLMCEISEGDARWKPAPDRFSIAEVLAHLSHSEGHCYRARLDRFLAEETPEFEPARRRDSARDSEGPDSLAELPNSLSAHERQPGLRVDSDNGVLTSQ